MYNSKKRKGVSLDDIDEEIRPFPPKRATIYDPNDPRYTLWPRPHVTLEPLQDTLAFQVFDTDYITSNTGDTKAPLVRLFGVTKEGNSVCATVDGFEPYFYVSYPPCLAGLSDDEACHVLKDALNARINDDKIEEYLKVPEYVTSVTLDQKRSIMNWTKDTTAMFKITTALPKHVPRIKSYLEGGLVLNTSAVGPVKTGPFKTYESTVLFALRFMIDKDMVGGCWVQFDPGRYTSVTNKKTHCQIEIEAHHGDLIAHKSEGEWANSAPARTLSFDIECAAEEGFPKPDRDPVIQIANVVTLQGQKTPLIKNVFVLGGCAPITGSDVRTFSSEEDLLMAWRDFVLESDPDIMIGYNIMRFDLAYLWDRAAHLKLKDFPFMSRERGERVTKKADHFESKARGATDSWKFNMTGRFFFDLLIAIKIEHKLRSYTLNAVSAHFLGDQKEDLHHSLITPLHKGTDEDRQRVAIYCLKDAWLPQRLMDKLTLFISYVEMARVTGVPIPFLITRGQSVKVMTMILRAIKGTDMVVPSDKKTDKLLDQWYEGAVVLDALKAFYDVPITTLDFASLYPSIMMAHNLCYSTLISPEKAAIMSPADYTKTPAGAYFVKPHIKKGVLPYILENLLSARGVAKKAMAAADKAGDEHGKSIQNCRQLALKISANSVYGFTGATIGALPCKEISASVTAFGREMIQFTKNKVVTRYTIANGYKANARVVYGDTDSVMVDFGVSLAEAMELGKEAAKYVTNEFNKKPISLEWEKCYYPYLLMSKKRYAGLLWTKPDKYDKLDAKGIETVRRDNCQFVSRTLKKCLDLILIKRDPNGAKEYAKTQLTALLNNEVDMSQLVISKGLSKTEYAGKQAHVEVNIKIQKRHPGEEFSLGDRVPYVLIQSLEKSAPGKKTPTYTKAEDPLYALERNLQIDTVQYLDMIKKPLMRFFKPIFRDPETDIMKGPHMRSRKVNTPVGHGIMAFAKVTQTCPGCKAPMKDGEKIPCAICIDNGDEVVIYKRDMDRKNKLESDYHRLWTQCQSCQGSLHNQVLCSANDCPIFYARLSAKFKLNKAREEMARYDW
jgi:DNA polymerase delta subunit 1